MYQLRYQDANGEVIAERGIGVDRDEAFRVYDAACTLADRGTTPDGAVVVALADDGKVHRRHRVTGAPDPFEAAKQRIAAILESDDDGDDREAPETSDGVRERPADSAAPARRGPAAAGGKTAGRPAKAPDPLPGAKPKRRD